MLVFYALLLTIEAKPQTFKIRYVKTIFTVDPRFNLGKMNDILNILIAKFLEKNLDITKPRIPNIVRQSLGPSLDRGSTLV